MNIAVDGGADMQITFLHLEWENGVASKRGAGLFGFSPMGASLFRDLQS